MVSIKLVGRLLIDFPIGFNVAAILDFWSRSLPHSIPKTLSSVWKRKLKKKHSQLEFSAMVAMLNIRLTLKSQNMMQSMKGAFLQILFLFGSVVSQKMSA